MLACVLQFDVREHRREGIDTLDTLSLLCVPKLPSGHWAYRWLTQGPDWCWMFTLHVTAHRGRFSQGPMQLYKRSHWCCRWLTSACSIFSSWSWSNSKLPSALLLRWPMRLLFLQFLSLSVVPVSGRSMAGDCVYSLNHSFRCKILRRRAVRPFVVCSSPFLNSFNETLSIPGDSLPLDCLHTFRPLALG